MAVGRRGSKQIIKREFDTIEALRLRARGMSYRDIGKELGIGRDTSRRYVQNALNALAEERAEETALTRMVLAERLGMVYTALADKVKDGDLPSIDRWIMAIKTEARLFGIVSAPPVAIQNNIVLNWPDQPQPTLPSDVVVMGGD